MCLFLFAFYPTSGNGLIQTRILDSTQLLISAFIQSDFSPHFHTELQAIHWKMQQRSTSFLSIKLQKQQSPTCPSPSHVLQLLLWDTKVLPGLQPVHLSQGWCPGGITNWPKFLNYFICAVKAHLNLNQLCFFVIEFSSTCFKCQH